MNIPDNLPLHSSTTKTPHSTTSLPPKEKAPQKCKIPVLDPYHPDIKKFMKHFTAPNCDYPQLTYVTDNGVLKVRDESKVTEAKFAYMHRVNDNTNSFTEWIKFYDRNDKTQNKGILDLIFTNNIENYILYLLHFDILFGFFFMADIHFS